jgi:hypothetical protein
VKQACFARLHLLQPSVGGCIWCTLLAWSEGAMSGATRSMSINLGPHMMKHWCCNAERLNSIGCRFWRRYAMTR